MAVGREQRQRLQHGDLQQELDPRKTQQELQRLEEGQEINAEQAQQLQPQLGNAALAALLARSAGSEGLGGAGGLDQEEEQVEELVEVEDEQIADQELDGAMYGGGGGGGGGGGSGDPWDMGKLFGGDDDDDAGTGGARNPRTRHSPVRPGEEPLDDEDEPEDDERAVPQPDLGAADDALVLPPAPDATDRRGDSRFVSVELALQDPARIARTSLEPEDLIERGGATWPLGRPLATARFLARASRQPLSRTLARGLQRGAAALLAPTAGASGAAACLATLAICVEASEAETSRRAPREVDRAVALSQEVLAWPMAVHSARRLARRRRLHAPLIVKRALGERPDPGRPPATRGAGSTLLGQRALATLLPTPTKLQIPDIAEPPSAVTVFDADLAAADALIEELTGGRNPAALPTDPILDEASLRPILDAATELVNAMGRCQVEFATAAIAAARVQPRANVQQTLVHADRALRQLARETVAAGDRLLTLQGRPRAGSGDEVQRILAELREQVSALDALRDWVLEAIARAATLDAA